MEAYYNKVANFYLQNKKIFIYLILLNILCFGFMIIHPIFAEDSFFFDPIKFPYILDQGRWTAFITQIFTDSIQIPYLTLLCLIINCMNAIILAKVLYAKNQLQAFIIGAMYSIFPVWSNLYGYYFMSMGYVINIMAVLLPILILREKFSLKRIFISVVLYAFSIGLYQIVIAFYISLITSVFIIEIINTPTNTIKILTKNVKMFIVFLLGVVVYFLMLKTLLLVFHIALSGRAHKNLIDIVSMHNLFSLIIKFYFKISFFDSPTPKILFSLFYTILLIKIILNFRHKKHIIFNIILLLTILILPFTPLILKIVHSNEIFFERTYLPYVVVYILAYKIFIDLIQIYKKLYMISYVLIFISLYGYVKDNNVNQYYGYKNKQREIYLMNEIVDTALKLKTDDQAYSIVLLADFQYDNKCTRHKYITLHDLFSSRDAHLCKISDLNMGFVVPWAYLRYIFAIRHTHGLYQGILSEADRQKYMKLISKDFPNKNSYMVIGHTIIIRINDIPLL